MSQTLPPEIRSELDHLKEEVESIKTLLAKASTSPLPNWLSVIFQGVTLTIVVGAAFWFGALGSTVARTETAVVGLTKSVQELIEWRGEVNGHLKQIDGRLDKIDSRLDKMEGRLDKMEGRLEKVEGRLEKVEGRLEKVESRLTAVESRLTGIERKVGR